MLPHLTPNGKLFLYPKDSPIWKRKSSGWRNRGFLTKRKMHALRKISHSFAMSSSTIAILKPSHDSFTRMMLKNGFFLRVLCAELSASPTPVRCAKASKRLGQHWTTQRRLAARKWIIQNDAVVLFYTSFAQYSRPLSILPPSGDSWSPPEPSLYVFVCSTVELPDSKQPEGL